MVSKALENRLEELEIRGRKETIQTMALLKLEETWRLAVPQTLDPSPPKKTTTLAGVKNSQIMMIIIIIKKQ